jgi:hypothetical protein
MLHQIKKKFLRFACDRKNTLSAMLPFEFLKNFKKYPKLLFKRG